MEEEYLEEVYLDWEETDLVVVEASEEDVYVDVEKLDQGQEDKGNMEKCSECDQVRKLAPMVKCNRCLNLIKVDGRYHFHKHEDTEWVLCQICWRREKKGEVEITILDKNNNGGSEDCPVHIPLRVKKSAFSELNNVPSEPEPLVTCCKCCKLFHCICVGFVSLKSAPVRSFTCSSCRAKVVKDEEKVPLTINPYGSFADCKKFSETDLSTFIENRLNVLLSEDTDEVCVRVLSCVNKEYCLTDILKDFLKGYPSLSHTSGILPYTSRVIACFQKMKDGGSVLFFAVYFQEYGSDCPLPNRNTIHISMLDSAQLFEPSMMRRKVYYSILVAYLGYMKDRGFDAVCFWSCPPITEDTEYLFPRRPETQRTLTADLLQKWYRRMMRIAKKVGYIVEFSTLQDWAPKEDRAEFFKKFPLYFGDFWPGHLEEAINTAKNEQTLKPPPKKKMKKSKVHSKSCSGTTTRKGSTALATELHDRVYKKIKYKLEHQKHNFFVMRLRDSEDQGEPLASRVGRTEPIISNPLVDPRDNLVEFFQAYGNHLEFRDVRKAKYATQMLLLQMVTDAPALFCSHCESQILSLGYSCRICEEDFCKACKNKHQHVGCSGRYIEIMPTINQSKMKIRTVQSSENGNQKGQLKKKKKRPLTRLLQRELMRNNKCNQTNIQIRGEEDEDVVVDDDRDLNILNHLEECQKTKCELCQSIMGKGELYKLIASVVWRPRKGDVGS